MPIGPISEERLFGHKAAMFDRIAVFFEALTTLVIAAREALKVVTLPR